MFRRISWVGLAAVAVAGCWGDSVPALDQVGASRARDGGATILFVPCPGERVQRIDLHRTDDDFEEDLGVLWSIEARPSGSSEVMFTAGVTPEGFEEIVPLYEALRPADHVQIVLTSSRVGTIPMSLAVAELREGQVRVRDGYRSLAEFRERGRSRC